MEIRDSASREAPVASELSVILDKIEARAENAGPAWAWHPGNWDQVTLDWLRSEQGRPMRDFVAASRTDVPALVKALRLATAQLSAMSSRENFGEEPIPNEAVTGTLAAVASILKGKTP